MSESPRKKKKRKSVAYKMDAEVADLIEADGVNKKVWDEVLACVGEGVKVSGGHDLADLVGAGSGAHES